MLASYVDNAHMCFPFECLLLPCIRSFSQLAAVYPLETHHVVLARVRSAQVCPFPIRKL